MTRIPSSEPSHYRIFLLSPARVHGRKASALLGSSTNSALARQLRSSEGVALGDLYVSLSSLYFRGKATYARQFRSAPCGSEGTFVITPGLGLQPPSRRVRLDEVRAIAAVEVSARNSRFADTLANDAAALLRQTRSNAEFVLLGSIATTKYVDPLLGVLGFLLLFPRNFVGVGDMARGKLMLDAARSGRELEYARVATELRRR